MASMIQTERYQPTESANLTEILRGKGYIIDHETIFNRFISAKIRVVEGHEVSVFNVRVEFVAWLGKNYPGCEHPRMSIFVSYIDSKFGSSVNGKWNNIAVIPEVGG